MPSLIAIATTPWTSSWAYALYSVAIVAVLLGVLRLLWSRATLDAEQVRQVEDRVRRRTAELTHRNKELEELNAQLLEASLTDSLTGLHNRRFFSEQIAKDIAIAQRRNRTEGGAGDGERSFELAFLMVDLDHFKSINDAFGHTAGDHVLVEVRGILLDCCRSSDIVVRWGGDEFLVVARDTDGHQAVALAERIRSHVKSGVFRLGNGQMLRASCSIGLAHYPFVRSHPEAVSWEQVMRLADHAMYQAKETRDAWVAYLSTASTLRQDGVLSFARQAPESMVREGRLDVLRSTDIGREASLGGLRQSAARSG